jgi:hypothetical protein
LNDDVPNAIGGACVASQATVTMTYTFSTQSSAGPFHIWMRNVADDDHDVSSNNNEDEYYDCTLSGVVGSGTESFRYEKPSAAPVAAYGPDCTDVNDDARFCWMAANAQGASKPYGAFELVPGEHQLTCTINVSSNSEHVGFDGIIVTNDLRFVPDAEAAPDACAGDDAIFNAGACDGQNWGPNHAPALNGSGHCARANLPEATPCGSSSSSTCDAPDSCNAFGACDPRYAPTSKKCGGDHRCDGKGDCDD